jgi:hypothetical protein
MAPRKKSVLGFVIDREAIERTDQQLWRLLRHRDPSAGRWAEVNEHEFARLVELWLERRAGFRRKAKLWKAGLPAFRRKLGLPPRGRRGPEPLRALGKEATFEKRQERAEIARAMYEAVLSILEDGGSESDVVVSLAEAWDAPVGSTARAKLRRIVRAGFEDRRTKPTRAGGVVLEFLKSEGFPMTYDHLRRHILRGRFPPKES